MKMGEPSKVDWNRNLSLQLYMHKKVVCVRKKFQTLEGGRHKNDVITKTKFIGNIFH